MMPKNAVAEKNIDDKIESLHRQLAELYEHKSLSASPLNSDMTRNTVATQKIYRDLAKIWTRYGILPPEYLSMRGRIARAVAAQQEFDSLSIGKFSIVLVPPSRYLNQESIKDIRASQLPPQASDYVGTGVDEKKTVNWQVLVVLTSQEGLRIKNVDGFMKDRSYVLGGKDARRLGFYEYIAMSLQCDQLFDIKTWTVLFKDFKAREQPVCVKFVNNLYRFERDDTLGAFEDNSFRPAISVN